MSPGRRSGVNWIRLKSRPRAVEKLRAINVLPSPGKSSNSTCPPASAAVITISSTPRLPTTARSTSEITFLLSAETSRISATMILHLRLKIIHCVFRIQIQRRGRGTDLILCKRKINEGFIQPRVEIFLHRLILDLGPAAPPTTLTQLAVDLTQPVGNLPLEIITAAGFEEPGRQCFHFSLRGFAFEQCAFRAAPFGNKVRRDRYEQDQKQCNPQHKLRDGRIINP